jgi:exodeoxyribonuclease V alpha subunit
MKIGRAGIDALNKDLQAKLNPPKPRQKDIEFERVTFRLGDKVMQIQNNYEIEWHRTDNVNFIGTGIFNGDIGTISYLNADAGEIKIEFDDGRVATYARPDLSQVALAYAITVHKSQGCEFDAIVMPVVMGAPLIFTRNLLYTAITRAKKTVVLVGTKAAINKMIRNNYVEKRCTLLKDFMSEQRKKFNELYGGQ